jgi:hypothetical protein
MPFLSLPFLSRVSARGLHAIDNADDLWQIDVLDRPSESLRAHEECARGSILWVKRVGVLNLGNYYFPHTLVPSGRVLFRAGFPQRKIDRARSIQVGHDEESPPEEQKSLHQSSREAVIPS